jgi:hypothetical protein
MFINIIIKNPTDATLNEISLCLSPANPLLLSYLYEFEHKRIRSATQVACQYHIDSRHIAILLQKRHARRNRRHLTCSRITSSISFPGFPLAKAVLHHGFRLPPYLSDDVHRIRSKLHLGLCCLVKKMIQTAPLRLLGIKGTVNRSYPQVIPRNCYSFNQSL